MKIAPTTFRSFTRWELFQFIDHVLNFAHKTEEEMPDKFKEGLSELQTVFDIYDIEIVQDRRPTPERLMEVDEERNYAIRTIHKVVLAFANYKYSPEKETASKILLTTFKYYGSGRKISRLSQDTKTAVITNLVQDLSKDVPKQHIATLGLTDVMEALHINNQVFSKEQLSRRSLEAEYVKGVVKNARLELQNKFMEFVALINALSVVEGPEKYIELKQIIMTLVHDSVAKVKLRTKKKVVQL